MTTQAWIYSNGNQECERAAMLLTSIYSDFHEYVLNKEFTESQFRAEFGPVRQSILRFQSEFIIEDR